jgi:hypothetical protein
MPPIDASTDHGDAGAVGAPGYEAEADRSPGEPRPRSAGTLTLELVISETDPLSGTVGPFGKAPGIEFHGWIDFMSAVSALASGPGGDSDRVG